MATSVEVTRAGVCGSGLEVRDCAELSFPVFKMEINGEKLYTRGDPKKTRIIFWRVGPL